MAASTLSALRQVVQGMTGGTGFDRVLNKMAVVSACPGKIVCEMKVEEEHVNRGGNLHGGLTATLVDVVSTTALLNTERALPGVSVDMNITYMSAAKLGEDIIITAQVLKEGKTLAFTTVDLTSKDQEQKVQATLSKWISSCEENRPVNASIGTLCQNRKIHSMEDN